MKGNPYYEIEGNLTLIYYNLTRKENVEPVALLYRRLLRSVKKTLAGDSRQIHYLKLAYKLIAQTRDIHFGKGERELSYAMIYVLYDFYPVLAIYLIHTLVQSGSYGCWSDMKRLCHYVKPLNPDHSILRVCIELMNNTLYKEQSRTANPISNLAKWIPRENKKYGWMFEPLVLDYYTRFSPNHLPDETHPSYYSAVDRCKMLYRKRIGKINRLLDTTEIKLCEKQPGLIHPLTVPLTAFTKYKRSLQNVLPPLLHEKSPASSYPLAISYFVKEAIRLTPDNGIETELVNLQWKHYSDSIGMWILDAYIPVVDMSHFMNKDALYNAIGIACLIAERSTLCKKILVFGNQPCWVNLDSCNGIVAMVHTLMSETRASSNTNCTILPAMELLEKSFFNADTPLSTIENIKLVILSSSKHESIAQSSTLIYWNVLTQYHESLPVPHDKPGTHIFSGNVFLPLLLSSNEKTSYQIVEEILSLNTRYDRLGAYIDQLVG